MGERHEPATLVTSANVKFASCAVAVSPVRYNWGCARALILLFRGFVTLRFMSAHTNWRAEIHLSSVLQIFRANYAWTFTLYVILPQRGSDTFINLNPLF